jgi:hypothetical protein
VPLLLLLGGGLLTAYVISLIGPAPRPAPLTPQTQAQLDATTAASQQAAASAAQAQATLAALQSGELFQPGFQGQPGATVSGVLVWRGEIAHDGAKVVYDRAGNAHYVYGA